SRAYALETPQGVKPGEKVIAVAYHFNQRGSNRLVAALHDHLLGHITPPAIGMLKMPQEVGGRFIIHARLSLIAFKVIMRQTPDTSHADDFIQLVLFDLHAQVRSNGCPLAFLDD